MEVSLTEVSGCLCSEDFRILPFFKIFHESGIEL